MHTLSCPCWEHAHYSLSPFGLFFDFALVGESLFEDKLLSDTSDFGDFLEALVFGDGVRASAPGEGGSFIFFLADIFFSAFSVSGDASDVASLAFFFLVGDVPVAGLSLSAVWMMTFISSSASWYCVYPSIHHINICPVWAVWYGDIALVLFFA